MFSFVLTTLKIEIEITEIEIIVKENIKLLEL
jgi:hypothetical protein